MEYLSKVLAYVTENMGFKFHPMCGKLKLSHLIFDYDLLLFSKSYVGSIMVLLNAFVTFSRAYGIQMSPIKTSAYFNGVLGWVKEDILFIIPKGVLSRLNFICMNYLWDGKVEHLRVPLFSWNKKISPKQKGGLGIRDSYAWNNAAMGKLLIWMKRNKMQSEHSLLKPDIVFRQIRSVVKLRIHAHKNQSLDKNDKMWLSSIELCM
ncbi:uncharacterized protein LOC141588270 [Silene latifolia]|uniref:uncharacterized protein LOC141588270 n=1 Tax=Silene latifolia TaxID=37657 RepID=UPI003D77DA93